VDEVEDFFARHLNDIEKAMREPDVEHNPHCRNGKRQWMFNRYWPFIHTWISTAVCVCEINQIMRQHRETNRLIGELVEALQPRVLNIDLSQLKPKTQIDGR
jgi:hypothetical protein